MDIHKPKAAHSWREFLIEIGTIICGILIALGLEQSVEAAHWREKLHQTREQLAAEVQQNVEGAIIWLGVAPCQDRQIADIETKLWAARASGRYSGAERFSPSLVRFQSEAWLNARSLQVVDRMGTDETEKLASFYFFPTEMTTSVVTLHAQAGDLELLSHPLDHMSPAEADELLGRLGRSKELFARMNYAAMLIIQEGKALHAHAPSPGYEALFERKTGGSAGCRLPRERVWDVVSSARDLDQAWPALNLKYRP